MLRFTRPNEPSPVASTSPESTETSLESTPQAAAMASEETTALIERLTKRSKRRKLRIWQIWAVMVAFILPTWGLSAYLNHYAFVHQAYRHGVPLYVYLGFALQALVPFIFPLMMMRMGFSSRRETADLERLATCDDVSAIRGLRHGGMVRDKNKRAAIMAAYSRLMNKVTEADVDMYTARELELMSRTLWSIARGNYKLFVTPEYEEVYVAQVRMLGRLGGERALKEITRLAESNPTTDLGKRMHEAAVEVLPRMKERLESMRPGAELLRASFSGNDAELLHAASQPAGSEDPSVLIRPVDAGPALPRG